MKKNLEFQYSSAVQRWLWLGVVLVFGQVVIGGITRLTDSGLSITEWNVIMGVLPPLNEAAWMEAFGKYQVHAKTQFEAIHSDMTLGEFKWIFFWEWFHRLWARMMGLIFLFPFIYFLWKKQIDKVLVRRLGIVIAIAMLAAIFGWIMVKSGLNTPDYAWVSAYKLMIHLGIGFTLFAYLLWTTFHTYKSENPLTNIIMWKGVIKGIFVLAFVQILLGGLMSGMKAGLSYPTFPSMNGSFIPAILFDSASWTTENFVLYNKHILAPTLVQVLHRFTAYALTIFVLWFIVKAYKTASQVFKNALILLGTVLGIQFLLGVFTLINCKGSIPVTLGVLHQVGGLIMLGTCVYLLFLARSE